MDDNTNANVPGGVPDMPAANPMGGSEPVVDQAPVAAPVTEEKCETCGNGSNNGNCVGCSVPNASCTCPPKVEGVEPPAQPVM